MLHPHVSRRAAPAAHPADLICCPRCGSTHVSHYRGDEYCCYNCWHRFLWAPQVPFDFVADGWTPELAAAQAAGDVILVRLPKGFYGVCVITEEGPFERLLRVRSPGRPTGRPVRLRT